MVAEIFETVNKKLTVLLTVFRFVLTIVVFVLTAFTRLLTARSPAVVGIPVKADPSPTNLPNTVPAETVEKKP